MFPNRSNALPLHGSSQLSRSRSRSRNARREDYARRDNHNDRMLRQQHNNRGNTHHGLQSIRFAAPDSEEDLQPIFPQIHRDENHDPRPQPNDGRDDDRREPQRYASPAPRRRTYSPSRQFGPLQRHQDPVTGRWVYDADMEAYFRGVDARLGRERFRTTSPPRRSDTDDQRGRHEVLPSEPRPRDSQYRQQSPSRRRGQDEDEYDTSRGRRRARDYNGPREQPRRRSMSPSPRFGSPRRRSRSPHQRARSSSRRARSSPRPARSSLRPARSLTRRAGSPPPSRRGRQAQQTRDAYDRGHEDSHPLPRPPSRDRLEGKRTQAPAHLQLSVRVRHSGSNHDTGYGERPHSEHAEGPAEGPSRDHQPRKKSRKSKKSRGPREHDIWTPADRAGDDLHTMDARNANHRLPDEVHSSISGSNELQPRHYTSLPSHSEELDDTEERQQEEDVEDENRRMPDPRDTDQRLPAEVQRVPEQDSNELQPLQRSPLPTGASELNAQEPNAKDQQGQSELRAPGDCTVS